MHATRINVRLLVTSIFYSLVLPLTIAMLLDWSIGWTPWLTIGASVIFIPLASVVVIRATLAELDRVIETVAPLEPDHQE
jgi:hypothetical protein